MSSQEDLIKETKQFRVELNGILKRIKDRNINSRPLSISKTKIEESVMWLGKELARLNAENPYPDSLNPSNSKVAPTADQAKDWFGNPPPDLTLSARLRGPEWIYNYMRGFYIDPKRPYGVNNVIYKDVGMPHVLVDLQGVCATAPELGVEPEVDPLSGKIIKSSGCSEYAVEGTLSPSQYDEAMHDLVNFLEYVGEPSRLQSEALGIKVLIFLLPHLVACLI